MGPDGECRPPAGNNIILYQTGKLNTRYCAGLKQTRRREAGNMDPGETGNALTGDKRP